MKDRVIYIADMDVTVKQLIKQNLETFNYEIKFFDNGEKLVWECNKIKPDLLIMDIKLHGIDGLEVCRKLRQEVHTSDLPILFLSDKKEEFDIVLGLEIGADDYMIKPFSMRELQSRIKAVLRRTQLLSPEKGEEIKLNDLRFDMHGRSVYNDKVSIKFSMKEFELLKLMLNNSEKTLTREFLLKEVWGSNYNNGTRTVDVHIWNVRRKLYELDEKHSYIECVRGAGYRLNQKKLNKWVV